jgi:hypothetical protein
MILQLDDALSADDCRSLVVECRACVKVGEVLRWPGFGGALAPAIVEECRSLLPFDGPLYPETVILTGLGPGGFHTPHADNWRPVAGGGREPNHTPHRDASAIYYLNDEFEGGEVVFADHGLTVKPRRGLLLAFPSDHWHEVLPVRSGVRYTMPIWFTRQSSLALDIWPASPPRS